MRLLAWLLCAIFEILIQVVFLIWFCILPFSIGQEILLFLRSIWFNQESNYSIFQHKLTPNYPVPKCSACQLYCSIKLNPSVIKQSLVLVKESIFSWDEYEVADFVSMYQFIIKLLVVFQVDTSVRYHTFIFIAGLFFRCRNCHNMDWKYGFLFEQERLWWKILFWRMDMGESFLRS